MENINFDILLKHIKAAFQDVSAELVNSSFEVTEKCEFNNIHKVAVVIGMSGNSKGRILLQADIDAINSFATAINFGDSFDDIKDLYFCIAEFSNMFCGRAATYINNEFKERKMWLTPPAIFSGKNLEISTPEIHSKKVCYTGKYGNFMIDVGFEGDN
jgi:CheY-specific phosphatase CheX